MDQHFKCLKKDLVANGAPFFDSNPSFGVGHFDEYVEKLNQEDVETKRILRVRTVMNVVSCFLIYNLAFSMCCHFLIQPKQPEFSDSVLGIGCISFAAFDLDRIIGCTDFALKCVGLVIGLTIGCQFKMCQQRGSMSTFYCTWIGFACLTLIDLSMVIVIQLKLTPLILSISLVRNGVGGIQVILLLYSLFHSKTDDLEPDEAARNVRLFLLVFSCGALSALCLNVSYLSDLRKLDSTFVKCLMFSLMWCRIFSSFNCSMFSFLIWHGMTNLPFRIDGQQDHCLDVQSPNKHLTLNCISLACQREPHNNDDSYLDEDDYSIRTVAAWRKVCFTICGTIQFSLAFYLLTSQLVSSTLWPSQYYKDDNHFMLSYLFLIGPMLLLRIMLVFGLADLLKMMDHLGLVVLHVIYLIASLIQMSFSGSYATLACNVLYGSSLGLMLDQICRLVSNHVTITGTMIQWTLASSIAYTSIMAYVHYYLIQRLSWLPAVIILNIFHSVFSILLTLFVSQCSCLVSKNGFDLIHMRRFSTNRDFSYLSNRPSEPKPSRYLKNNRKTSDSTITAYRMKYRIGSMVSSWNLSN